MIVTVCELPSDPQHFSAAWQSLCAHTRKHKTELLLLPEMIFSPWFCAQRPFRPAVWDQAITTHDSWIDRLPELHSPIVTGSRPVNKGERRLNESFLWTANSGYLPTHHKYYLPDEPGFWEASWYERGFGTFALYQEANLALTFLICTELWFMQHARAYGQAGAHLLLNPRATERQTSAKWLAGGQTASIVSGCFGLSSNHQSLDDSPTGMGGQGWIIDPNGIVLGVTSKEQPFLSIDIDLQQAVDAKQSYPRYVQE